MAQSIDLGLVVGKDGKDGVSPEVTVAKADGYVTVTVTDKNGVSSASLRDIETAADIPTEEDGVSVQAALAGLAIRTAADVPTKEVGVSVQDALDAKIPIDNVVNNLTATAAGYVLDARQGKVLNDLIPTSTNPLAFNGGGHGKTTRHEGLYNLFAAGTEWVQNAKDANNAVTWGMSITSPEWTNLPHNNYGILLSFATAAYFPTSGYCMQIWVDILANLTWYRIKTDANPWGAWVKNSLTASGTVNISLTANTAGGVTVTVPSGIKYVAVTPVTTSPQNVHASCGYVDGTSVWIGAHSTTAQTLPVHWIAMG